MRKFICFPVFISFLLFSVVSFAQSSAPSWQAVMLTAAGTNTLYGVEVLYALENCNGEDVVHIRLINKNDYSVKVKWQDGVFTDALTTSSEKKSIRIKPQSELTGDCSGTVPELTLTLRNFDVKKEAFKRYSALEFSVSTIN